MPHGNRPSGADCTGQSTKPSLRDGRHCLEEQARGCQAVAAAGSFVEMADRVVILSVDEDAETDEGSGERLRYALSWHNPKTTLQRLKRDERPAVETMLAAAGQWKPICW